MASTTLKIALLAPIPSASARTATAVNPGLLTRPRTPKRTSCQIVSTVDSLYRTRNSRIQESKNSGIQEYLNSLDSWIPEFLDSFLISAFFLNARLFVSKRYHGIHS